MDFDPGIFDRIVATYEALGLPAEKIGEWCLPRRDAVLLIEALDPQRHRRLLDVGTFIGVSALLMALHAPEAEVHSVDPDLPLDLGTPLRGGIAATELRRAQEIAAAAAERLGVADRVILHRGGFAVAGDYASRLGDALESRPVVVGPELCRRHGPFDLIFVDGLHYADAVLADLELAAQHLSPGGSIALHDVIGLWGANVRWALHRFLERHPDFVLWHEPYRELYLAVGRLQRRVDAPPALSRSHPQRPRGGRLIDDPRFHGPLLAAAAAALRDGDAPRCTHVLELRAADMPSLLGRCGAGESAAVENDAPAPAETTEPSAGAAEDERSVIVEHAGDLAAAVALLERPARDTTGGRVGGAVGTSSPAANELVLCLGVLDRLDDAAAADLLAALARRGSPVLFGFTPPGERGVAAAHSRTLPQNLSLLASAGFSRGQDLSVALEPHLFPYWTPLHRENSHLLHVLVAQPGAARDGAEGTRTSAIACEARGGGAFDAATAESHALGILHRDLLTLHVMGRLRVPTAEVGSAGS